MRGGLRSAAAGKQCLQTDGWPTIKLHEMHWESELR
jgi:hypothetical protein